MNLRTLKKLSKRAAPLLPILGDHRQQFRAERGDNYLKCQITDRKHWERGRSVHADCISDREIKTPARDGNGWVYIHPPHHPRKGTVMVGAMSGYYEPEWDEETAWDALKDLVYVHFTDWGEDDALLTRQLDTVGDFFAAAADMIAELAAEPPLRRAA
jgi:hypothetical protein